MRAIVIALIIGGLSTAHARQCVDFFSKKSTMTAEQAVVALEKASSIEELLRVPHEEGVMTLGLHPGQRQFVEKFRGTLGEVMKKDQLKPVDLLSLKIFPIIGDPKYLSKGLVFFVINEKAYYLAKDAGVVDLHNQGKSWAAIERSSMGFMARSDMTFKMDKELFLTLSKEGELFIQPRHEKDPLILDHLVQNSKMPETLKGFIKEYKSEITDILEITDLTVEQLLNAPLVEAFVKSTGEEVLILTLDKVGDVYFTKSTRVIDASNSKRWGFFNDHSIGFLKGSNVELQAESGVTVQIKPGNRALFHPVDAEALLDIFIEKGDEKIKHFVTTFRAELSQLYKQKKIDTSDIISNNLVQIISEKSGEAVFAILKGDSQVIYFTENPSKVSADGVSKAGEFSQINTAEVGNEFYIVGQEFMRIKLVSPPGFNRGFEARVVLNEDVYIAMKEEQERAQQEAQPQL